MKNKESNIDKLLPLEVAELKVKQFGIDLYNALLIESLMSISGSEYSNSSIFKNNHKNMSGSSDFQAS